MVDSSAPSICDACSRLDRVHEALKEVRQQSTCQAFPDGIPSAIRLGGTDHRVPFRGDRGIQFELQPGEEETLKFYEKVKQELDQ